MSTGFDFTVEGGVATITLNRPEVRNAISGEILQALIAPLQRIAADPAVRCLVFRGAGEHFCGGGDVKGFGRTLEQSPEERRVHYAAEIAASGELFGLLSELAIPVVSVVRGGVAGAGLAFVLAADVALVSDTAAFVFAHSRVGLAIDAGLSAFLPRAVGLRKARELAVTAARIDAAEAFRIGVASRVLPDAELDAAADALIRNLASGATRAIGWSKRLLNASPEHDVRTMTRMEADALAECAATADFAEGVSAFLESRKPRFTGA